MPPISDNAPTPELPGVPGPVLRVVQSLTDAGHPSFLVGGCVRDLLRGSPPVDYDIATPAGPAEVLRVFPRAIPIGIRHGTVMVPTASGPVDITTYRQGGSIEEDLAHRDFTMNALAYDPGRPRLLDPFDGRADLARGLLRAVRDARERFAEDPLRALRGARLAASFSLDVDPAVEDAMAAALPGLREVARERVRHELGGLLLAPDPARGLELLRRAGIEADLAPNAAPDAPAVIAALPADLGLRLAGWLRGTRATPILRRLRFSRRVTGRVERLLRWHPIEVGVVPSREASVRRHLKRVGERNAEALLLLRRAELHHGAAAASLEAKAGLERVEALEAGIERVRRVGQLALQRHDLAIDGEQVMQLLGRGPGPVVGRALRYLTERVVEDPTCNRPEALRKLLEAWARDALEP
jgi:tRNA nucleotidyltransferase (CCA-adding enzyme)